MVFVFLSNQLQQNKPSFSIHDACILNNSANLGLREQALLLMQADDSYIS
jgi:hypothetical protein